MFAAEQPPRGNVPENVAPLKIASVHRFRGALDHSLQQIATAAQVNRGFVLAVLRDEKPDAGASERKRYQHSRKFGRGRVDAKSYQRDEQWPEYGGEMQLKRLPAGPFARLSSLFGSVVPENGAADQ